ncbi:MAG: hypothetical protein V4506_13465 [Bacteroidota bacterium]
MKQTFITSVIIAALVLPFSCKKKHNAVPDNTTPSTTTGTTGGTTGTTTTGSGITYSENGSTVSVDSVNAVLYTLGVMPYNREIDVYAFKTGNQVLELHFLPKTGAQTVGANFGNAWLTFLINNGLSYPGDYFTGTSGSFNLTACDTINNSIVGTFNFTGDNGSVTKTISAGTLHITKIRKQ